MGSNFFEISKAIKEHMSNEEPMPAEFADYALCLISKDFI